MTPTFWIVLAAVLAVAEMLTGTFYLLVLALGALAGSVVAYMGMGASLQVLVAAIVAGLGFLGLHKFRPARTRRAAESNPDVNLDIDTLVKIGRIGADGVARVLYRGTEWSARVENAVTQVNVEYRIARIEGATLILHPIN